MVEKKVLIKIIENILAGIRDIKSIKTLLCSRSGMYGSRVEKH